MKHTAQHSTLTQAGSTFSVAPLALGTLPVPVVAVSEAPPGRTPVERPTSQQECITGDVGFLRPTLCSEEWKPGTGHIRNVMHFLMVHLIQLIRTYITTTPSLILVHVVYVLLWDVAAPAMSQLVSCLTRYVPSHTVHTHPGPLTFRNARLALLLDRR